MIIETFSSGDAGPLALVCVPNCVLLLPLCTDEKVIIVSCVRLYLVAVWPSWSLGRQDVVTPRGFNVIKD